MRILPAILGAFALAQSQILTEPGRFAAELLFSGNGTTSIEFDPDGRLLICEKQGRILIALPDGRGGFSTPAEFADLRTLVFSTGESGLLGLALDPDYRQNRFLYLFHTTPGDQRLVRIQAQADFRSATTAEPAVILAGLPRNATFHKAGDIHIHPSEPEYVYIALGDDAQENAAQDLDAWPGKILRVHKATGQGAPGNPFHAGDGSTIRSRVWASGFRNPFRFVLHPGNPEILYVAENGGPANSRAREDRVAWVRKGANCAWSSAAYAAGANSPWFNPPDSKCKVLATDQPSTVGIAMARTGGFADAAGAGNAVLFVSNLGFPNLGGYQSAGSIRRWRLTGTEWDQVTPVEADGADRFVSGAHGADLEFGPDGNLYASSTHGEAAIGGWYVFRRIRYTGGPVAVAAASREAGASEEAGASKEAGASEGRTLGNSSATPGGRWFVTGRPGMMELIDLRGRRITVSP